MDLIKVKRLLPVCMYVSFVTRATHGGPTRNMPGEVLQLMFTGCRFRWVAELQQRRVGRVRGGGERGSGRERGRRGRRAARLQRALRRRLRPPAARVRIAAAGCRLLAPGECHSIQSLTATVAEMHKSFIVYDPAKTTPIAN